MHQWLAMPALLALLTAAAGHAQMSHAARPTAPQGHLQSLNFSLPGQQGYDSPGLLDHGMVTRKEVGPDSFFGVGLVKMHGRKRDGSDMRAGVDPVVTDNPAVTFVVKF